MVKTATFNGTKYNVVETDKVDGYTDTHPLPKEIVNCAKKGTMAELITWLHEAKHAGDWNKSEKIIDRQSIEEGRLLWRLGYRRRKPRARSGNYPGPGGAIR